MTVYTVSQVNRLAASLLADHPILGDMTVKGELSGIRVYPSGHMYMTLKDESAAISCVMFRSFRERLEFVPREGDKVEVRASAGLYERDGRFQLKVFAMRPAGIGDLYQQFEKLKKELEAKGYFDPSRKRPIPTLPKVIGVVTSRAGAVIRDIINVLRRRFPGFTLKLYPVSVQGKTSAAEIARAIDWFNRNRAADVLIIGRGGGSQEDLWSFNERIVADAVYRSEIPIISAVGHETDFTISDFVADLRAPTPSAAAELCVPLKSDWIQFFAEAPMRMLNALNKTLARERNHLRLLTERKVLRRPEHMLLIKRDRLAKAERDLGMAFAHTLRSERSRFGYLRPQLKQTVARLLEAGRRRVTDTDRALRSTAESLRKHYKTHLQLQYKALLAIDPNAVIKRGYSIVRDPSGRVISRVADLKPDDIVRLQMQDGSAGATITDITDSR